LVGKSYNIRMVEQNKHAPNSGRLFSSQIKTPIGEMIAIASPNGLCLLEFADRPGLELSILAVQKTHRCRVEKTRHPTLSQTQAQLEEYFSDAACRFTVPLLLQGTDLQVLVWNELQKIPPGETLTYKQLAERLGCPKAVRAVGHANACNPIAVIVPCHRLVGSDGALHGYNGGLWRKEWLLEHEKKMNK
jgi:O-6-methylguanine DNA methyltransferase